MKLKMIMMLGVHKILLILVFIFFSLSSFSKPIQRQIAEIKILDKITAKVKTYEIKINNFIQTDSIKIEIYACYTNPSEEIPEDYVLLKVFDYMNLEGDKLIYQGWMISSSPSSTPLEHPIYDLWLNDCKIDIDS